MSSLDRTRIDHLYRLLRNAEDCHDMDGAAALKWAIFTLEQFLS